MKAKPADITNPDLQLAYDFVQHTGKNIFLTGKAGTGKTTFLHSLKHNTSKRMVVTAPTGVAAINAGGVTLHSFFQLPFGPYLPGSDMQRQSEQRRFSREKINIIKGLDLLVIDEISMVRADLLDGVDAVLRRYKHPQLPFGGVQLLMIGDLHQLAPVVKDDEWDLLNRYYATCYFFSSHALQQAEMISIELRHIYRQSDARFIELLNRVRDNALDGDVLQALNARYLPGFKPKNDDDYITLTTHNHSADTINNTQLQALDAKPLTYLATIEGDYPEYSFPTAAKLLLKKGAQVMFVRNDRSPDKRYYNGKIGKIVRLSEQGITVKCPNDVENILVEPVTWENIKYSVDANTREITEQVIGSFSQYPLRLAWAITIHKSQGLTFERAIIDAKAAFSHGQVYVALSRCKTFEGLVLSSPISQSAVKTDSTVAGFVVNANQNPPTQRQFNAAKIAYQQGLLLDWFDCQALAFGLRKLTRLLRDNRQVVQFPAIETLAELEKQVIDEVVIVADKFKRQLQSLFDDHKTPEDDRHLQERVGKAAHYFIEKLQKGLEKWVFSFHFDTDNKEIKKQITKSLEALQRNVAIKKAIFQHCLAGFSVKTCLQALAHAEIDFRSPSSVTQPLNDHKVQDIKYPELLHALKTWRTHQAQEEQLEAYRILHQRVLIQIAQILPDSVDALLCIKGIGKHTAEKYAESITAIVREFCREHKVEPNQSSPESTTAEPDRLDSSPKNTKKDTKQISYELYVSGKTIPQIAEERGLVVSTIEGHLAHFVGLGLLSITAFVTEAKAAMIKQAIDEKTGKSLKVLKEHLGNAVSYAEIQMVLESTRGSDQSHPINMPPTPGR